MRPTTKGGSRSLSLCTGEDGSHEERRNHLPQIRGGTRAHRVRKVFAVASVGAKRLPPASSTLAHRARDGGIRMSFTDGSMCAIEALMREKPGYNHYDDGCDGKYPECRNCRYHTPYSLRDDCVFDECPYLVPEASAGRKKGGGRHGSLPR